MTVLTAVVAGSGGSPLVCIAFAAFIVGLLIYSYLEEKRLVGRRRRGRRWGDSSGSDASGGWDGPDSGGGSGCGGGSSGGCGGGGGGGCGGG